MSEEFRVYDDKRQRVCEPCRVVFVYPTPQGLGLAWSNHTRSETGEHQSRIRVRLLATGSWRYVGDPGQLARYGWNRDAVLLWTLQEKRGPIESPFYGSAENPYGDIRTSYGSGA